MKKRLNILFAAVCVIVLCCALAACGSKGEKDITVLLVDLQGNVIATVEWNTDAAYLLGALEEMNADAKGEAEFLLSEGGEFGKTIEGFRYDGTVYEGDLAAHTFVSLYSTTEKVLLQADYGAPVTLLGTTYRTAANGISTMPIENGVSYALIITCWD